MVDLISHITVSPPPPQPFQPLSSSLFLPLFSLLSHFKLIKEIILLSINIRIITKPLFYNLVLGRYLVYLMYLVKVLYTQINKWVNKYENVQGKSISFILSIHLCLLYLFNCFFIYFFMHSHLHLLNSQQLHLFNSQQQSSHNMRPNQTNYPVVRHLITYQQQQVQINHTYDK